MSDQANTETLIRTLIKSSVRKYIQLRIGNNRGYFDNLVIVRIQTGHFQVDPDQVIGVRRHVILHPSKDYG